MLSTSSRAQAGAAVLPAAVPHQERTGSQAAGRVALAALLAVAAGLVLGQPVLTLCGLALGPACLLGPWIGWDLALPAGVLLLLAAVTTGGVGAAALEIDLLADGGVVAAALVVAAAAIALLVRRLVPGGAAGAARVGRLERVVHVLAGATAAVGAVQGLSTQVAASWGLMGTDLAQHVIEVQDVRREGALDYSDGPYPRALHLLLALVSRPGLPSATGDLLAHDIRLVAAASWMAFALLILTAAAVARRLAASLGLARSYGGAAGVAIAASLLLTNGTNTVFVSMGAVPSLLAAIALLAVPAAVLELERRPVDLPRARALVAVAATATMLGAHLWQALVVVPPVALAVHLAAARCWRSSSRWHLSSRDLALLAAPVVLLALVALPGMLGVVRAGGTSLSGIPGEVPSPPWVVLLLSLLGALVLPAVGRWRSLTVFTGSAIGLAVVAAVLLAGAGKGLDLTQYYPAKALWFLTLVLAPVAALLAVSATAVACTTVWRVLGRLGAGARVGRVAVFGAVVALLVSFVLPQFAAARSSTVDGIRPLLDPGASAAGMERLEIAAAYGSRFSPRRTVPVGVGTSAVLDRSGGYVVSKLISAQTGQVQTHGRPLFVCEEVRAVSADRQAVVVTKIDVRLMRDLMRRGGCGDVPVVRVDGEIDDTQVLIDMAGG